MPRELEEYSKELCNLSYENACSGNYNILDFSSFQIQGDSEPQLDGTDIPTKVHLREFEGAGDISSNSQEVEEFLPYEHQDAAKEVDGYFDKPSLTNGNTMEEFPWKTFVPSNFSYSTFERNGLKIRYTRQYLLNCQRNPLSTGFPDCLLKYVSTDEIFLKKPEVRYGCRNIDHILFYSSLPRARMKHPLGNCFGRNIPHLIGR